MNKIIGFPAILSEFDFECNLIQGFTVYIFLSNLNQYVNSLSNREIRGTVRVPGHSHLRFQSLHSLIYLTVVDG